MRRYKMVVSYPREKRVLKGESCRFRQKAVRGRVAWKQVSCNGTTIMEVLGGPIESSFREILEMEYRWVCFITKCYLRDVRLETSMSRFLWREAEILIGGEYNIGVRILINITNFKNISVMITTHRKTLRWKGECLVDHLVLCVCGSF